MRNTRVVLVWVCVLAVAFGSGAATYAQLSDTETAVVSVTAGTWNTIPTEFCGGDDGRIYYYHQQGNNGFDFRSGNLGNIIEFPDYLYEKTNPSGKGIGIIGAKWKVKDEYDVEIIAIKISHGNTVDQTNRVRFDKSKPSGFFDNSGFEDKHINKVWFCAVEIGDSSSGGGQSLLSDSAEEPLENTNITSAATNETES